MSKQDREALEEEFGNGVLEGEKVRISKSYGGRTTTWSVPINQTTVLNRLMKAHKFSREDKKALRRITSTAAAALRLEAQKEPSKAQSDMLATIKGYRKSNAHLKAIDILEERTPKFMYFSHYDRMSGQISVNQLQEDENDKNIEVGDQVFLDFLQYAGTNLEELRDARRFEDLNAKCEAAANRITEQIFEYWTQNDQLRIEVRLDEGKPEDPPPFNEGAVARARVWNDLHRVSVPFSERSAGFIWFFSFLVKFAQIKKSKGDVIILLDEPGLTLHGTAQKDLLRYFQEELEPHHQIIYTTHSPFMVPADDLASVRTVEDVVREDQRRRQISDGTKIRADVLTTDPQTNFPIFGAMGFEVTQGLIIAPDTLLVEGPSDILYLQAVSRKLAALGRTHLDPKWAICPSGGIDKVLPFVRLFHGNDLNTVVLTDFDRGQRRKLDELYKSELLEQERIILANEITGQAEADIEDFFTHELWVEIVNRTYALEGEHRLTAEKLMEADENTERAVKKAEMYFRLLPGPIPMLNHFDPALYLLQHPELLDGDEAHVMGTLDTFEEAFRRVAKYA